MKTTVLQIVLCTALLLSGCGQQQRNNLENLPLTGFQYPVAALLQDRHPSDGHYQITIYDEGAGGTDYVLIEPADKNEIGSKDAVDEATLFEMKGKFYQYAAFYDNWMIKESVESVLDENGILSKTITIKYNPDGIPVEYTEVPAEQN